LPIKLMKQTHTNPKTCNSG